MIEKIKTRYKKKIKKKKIKKKKIYKKIDKYNIKIKIYIYILIVYNISTVGINN